MIKVSLSGYTGSIGKKLFALKSNILKYNNFLNKSSNLKKFKKIKKSNILIDFSIPNNTLKLIYFCLKYKKNIIIGTTGFDKNQMKFIKKSSKYISVFLDYNYNYNFYLYLLILKFSYFVLKNMKILILESHRYKKLDKPSGSYYKICRFLNNKFHYLSKRIGDEKGIHEMIFHDKYNYIKIEHKIFSRKSLIKNIESIVFFMINKKKGLYNLYFL
ncbi:dihydrodipicolinate reductase C-terminal domain-containing protein [Candidatus Vidania fulgoroideorum]